MKAERNIELLCHCDLRETALLRFFLLQFFDDLPILTA